jgi:hypothetical protein
MDMAANTWANSQGDPMDLKLAEGLKEVMGPMVGGRGTGLCRHVGTLFPALVFLATVACFVGAFG